MTIYENKHDDHEIFFNKRIAQAKKIESGYFISSF